VSLGPRFTSSTTHRLGDPPPKFVSGFIGYRSVGPQLRASQCSSTLPREPFSLYTGRAWKIIVMSPVVHGGGMWGRAYAGLIWMGSRPATAITV